MRRFGILLLVLVIGILATLGIAYRHRLLHRAPVHAPVNKEEEALDLKEAQKLLDEGKPTEALAIINRYAWEIEQNVATSQQWLKLLIKASTETEDIVQLVGLYQYFPAAFQNDEKASLYAADAYILSGKSKEYEAVRDKWKGRETLIDSWFDLDVDKLLLDGKRKEAIDMLKSKTFEGKADTGRLIRLALLSVSENPKQAWDYLSQAYAKDPQNPSIRSYRAKILEAFGKNSLALTEYIAAVRTAPRNIYLRDQLAQFFIRHQNYVEAMQVLVQSLNPPSLDFIWMETFFWNKVAIPINFDWKKATPPQGKMLPFVNYLINLPSDEFWDAKSFDQIPNSSVYLKTQQSTFWLRLLDALKHEREQEAFNLLKYNLFRTISWAPHLERALKRILAYRLNGTFSYDPLALVNKTPENEIESKQDALKQLHPYFATLEELAQPLKAGEKPKVIPDDLKNLLKSRDAFAAAFLAEGWFEAAIQLNSYDVVPADFPDWVSLGFSEAMRTTRGNLAALKFASIQHPTPTLTLLIGEIYIAGGDLQAGIEHLSGLVKNQDEVGYRAAWVLSLAYLQQKEYEKARQTVMANQKLNDSKLGKETLARIALSEGKEDEAYQLYTSIQDQSVEAKSFLARKAYDEKNWSKARELTEDLLREYPTSTVLQENLKKIMEEEKSQK
jgi:thioredoxin-like negative regulator of GroEL